jgi:radical SAM PhpK family P-methyltransferase
MTDCLIIGFYDADFPAYVDMVRSMGAEAGAYRDLSLAFVEYENKPQRSMDLLNHFYFQDKPGPHEVFHNADFIWPVVTYLSSFLKKHGLSFEYVNLPHLEKEKFKEVLLKSDPLTIAITTTLYVSAHPILEIISFIKQYNQKAKIVVGGPYISNQIKTAEPEVNQQVFKYLGADFYVFCQEGEMALVNLINALKNGTDLDLVDNIAYRKGKDYHMTRSSIESNPLEENPIDYTLFSRHEVDEFVTLRTAKSCPFSCSFCGFPQRAGKYKYLSVELAEQELNAIREIGSVTTLTFIDDTFNVPKARFKEMLRMMIRNNYGFKWNCFYRSDHGDAEAIELMGKAGCEGVFLGVESGSDQMLLRMNKTARRKDYLEAIPLLRDAGISTHASLIIGFPGETYDTVAETVDLIETAKPDFYRAQLWYADPITPIWDQREQYGVKGSAFSWSHNTMDSATACDLVDKLFFCVENSIWLPQFGFEQWSTFYLQRKGMSLDRVRQFLKLFNTAIKERMLFPERKTISEPLLEKLRLSCLFDKDVPEVTPDPHFSPTAYLAAEKFWGEEFRDVAPAPTIRAANEETPDGPGSWSSLSHSIESSLLRPGIDVPLVMLAAYAILLSRMSGRQEVVILSHVKRGSEEPAVLPLRLLLTNDERCSEFIAKVAAKLNLAAEHGLYGLHITTNPLRMDELGCRCPVLDVGYWFGGDTAEQLSGTQPSLKLVLNLTRNNAGAEVNLHYRTDSFHWEVMDDLAFNLMSVFQSMVEKPDLVMSEIVVSFEDADPNTHSVDFLAAEAFNF